MKKIHAAPLALALLPGVALAGGVDRSGQSIAPLFEDGTYAEFSIGRVNPDVSGTAGGVFSGDMSGNYTQFAGAYKRDINDRLSFALIYDQPYGADVSYPAGTGYAFAGATAELTAHALSGILRYKFNDNFSIHGGIRLQTLEAEVGIPTIASYTANGDRDEAFGYLVGAAYEKPEIALRVALTYFSKIEHELGTAETSLLTGGSTINSTTTIETPEAVNLDFQTGIAKDTLLFGQIRWVDWSEFDISPVHYSTALVGSPLVSFADERVTYTIGVGRAFTENWAGSIAISYEETLGGTQSNLGPTDGRLGLTVGAKYTKDKMTISGGINYTRVGSAATNTTVGRSAFGDNDSVGFGIKVGYHF